MVDRIKKIMEYKEMTPTQFADAIEINRSSLTHIFSGRNQPSLDVVKKILTAFSDINTEWLIMGTGEMLGLQNQSNSPASKKVNQILDLFQEESTSTAIDPQLDIFSSDEKSENEDNYDEKLHIKKHTSTLRDLHKISSDVSSHQILNSQEDKIIEKIIIFYNDNTFELYLPK